MGHRPSYLLTHLLLFGRMGLHVLAEGAGVGVALGAAGDLTGVRLLQHQRGRGGVSGRPPARPRGQLRGLLGAGAGCRFTPCPPSMSPPGGVLTRPALPAGLGSCLAW